MKKVFARTVEFLLVMCMVCACIMTGCSNSSSVQNSSSTVESKSSTTVESQPSTVAVEPVKLTFFSAIADAEITNHKDVPSMQELEKLANVSIEWIHPPKGQENEQFNLMIASQEYPDLIYYNWASYPGGPEKAILDNVIIKLNDYVEKNAPNLTALYKKYPEACRQAVTDQGTQYMFPFIRGVCLDKSTAALNFSQGPIYRKDWADKLGIAQPKTINDWYKMLVAFRDKDPNENGKKDEIPFSGILTAGTKFSVNYFTAAYGILDDFYVENDKINHALLSPKFKEYLNEMRKWYAEGLIDKDYLATDANTMQAKTTSGLVGAFFGSESAHFAAYSKSMEKTVPNAKLTAIEWPQTAEGQIYTAQPAVSAVCAGRGIALSSRNKNIEASMKYADYIYSDAGIKLVNYGIEGKHYTIENGTVKWTAEMQKSIDEKGFRSAVIPVAFGGRSGWIYQDTEIVKMGKTYPGQLEAVYTWGKASAGLIPPTLTPTPEESTRIAEIMSQVNTYKDEMVGKYIMGQIPESSYDKIVSDVKNMKLEEAVAIENAAYTRYKNR